MRTGHPRQIRGSREGSGKQVNRRVDSHWRVHRQWDSSRWTAARPFRCRWRANGGVTGMMQRAHMRDPFIFMEAGPFAGITWKLSLHKL
jgi:hypothetical protein